MIDINDETDANANDATASVENETESTTLKPDNILDKVADFGDTDKTTTAKAAILALAVYGVLIVLSCIGKYVATKIAVKAALRDSGLNRR